jgi:hypothetical protein
MHRCTSSLDLLEQTGRHQIRDEVICSGASLALTKPSLSPQCLLTFKVRCPSTPSSRSSMMRFGFRLISPSVSPHLAAAKTGSWRIDPSRPPLVRASNLGRSESLRGPGLPQAYPPAGFRRLWLRPFVLCASGKRISTARGPWPHFLDLSEAPHP